MPLMLAFRAETEYILGNMETVMEQGFKPELYGHLNDHAKDIANAWGMATRATPVPGSPLHRSALWYGERFNHNDEGLGIVMALPQNRKFPQHVTEAEFFIGVVHQAQVLSADNPTDVFVDAAIHSWRQTHGMYALLSNLIASTTMFVSPPRS